MGSNGEGPGARLRRHNVTVTGEQWRALLAEAERLGLRGASSVIQAYAQGLVERDTRARGARGGRRP